MLTYFASHNFVTETISYMNNLSQMYNLELGHYISASNSYTELQK